MKKDDKNDPLPAEMNLAELSARSGVPGRTIRLYIAQGLLPGPLRAGRLAAYGPQHLETLGKIRAMQRRGLTLAHIRQALAAGEPAARLPEPTRWWNFRLAPDVAVLVAADAPPWRLRQIHRSLTVMKQYLDAKSGKENFDDCNREC